MIIAERGYCDSSDDWIRRIHKLLDTIVNIPDVVLQIRNKHNPLDWTALHPELAGILTTYKGKVVLNGTILPQCIVARHLPQSNLSTLIQAPLIGASIHSEKALQLAQANNIDYVQVGAVFKTAKPVEPIGIDGLRHFCQISSLPVFAVGGIDRFERLLQCINAGSSGVSIGRWILNSSEPQNLIESILSLLHDHKHSVR